MEEYVSQMPKFYLTPIELNSMTPDYFDALPETTKKEMIVDAEKVGEYNDDIARYELFKIDNFFVEVKVSFLQKYRRILKTYLLKEVPLIYAGNIFKTFTAFCTAFTVALEL